MRILLAGLAAAGLFMAAAPVAAQAVQPAIDYGQDETWLCRPGRQDACAVDLTATIVGADGSYRREPFGADPKAAVDCFYVYPTASADPTPNSDMIAGPEEKATVARQLARFASVCRIFAPIYRQITIPALRAATAGKPMATDREMAYRDVRDAWNQYLKADNGGRGVILFGHSQGAGVLKRLIAEEIDGKPISRQIVAAYLPGTNVLVPTGKAVGGDFKAMPLCYTRVQTGCVVSWVTFRESAPPPANSRFGRTAQPGMQVACINPAAPGGGTVDMSPVFGAKAMHPTAAPPKPWVKPMRPIETPYVRVPGLIAAHCVHDEHGGYLAIRVNARPDDPRTDEITGDHLDAQGRVQPDWGLHSLDVPVTMGDLIQMARSQSRTWLARR